ncbi:ATP-binding cassette sub- A member 5 [Halocaridina rubra]|uniref:ATP-binding cassette sub- A member 5 n=1 Tax=Halocaridina rubra TaxID=373956 RepID=A0AAN9AC88_HALRR
MMIGLTFSMIPAGLAGDLVHDREIGARSLLRLNGVGFHIYFSSFLLVMCIMYLISYFALLIIIMAFGIPSLIIPPAFAAIAILYFMYLPLALLSSTVLCYVFDKSETARQFFPSIVTAVGFIGYTVVAMVDMLSSAFGRYALEEESSIATLSDEDEDVKMERERVSAALEHGEDVSPVLIYNLNKVYKCNEQKHFCKMTASSDKITALRSVSLEVKSGQVFGLLGPNGAGKTTCLRIMTAEEQPSQGRVQISGTDVTSSLSKVFGNLGYCPQHDALWNKITVAEHIECFANIRGVKEEQVKVLIDTYVKGLEIEEHRKKQTKHCSGGTKRKLSYILCMLGRPHVVLLDEPSTGMDPMSKRFLWNSILASFKGERSAILTTHSMEEADALCSRIGILVRGGLRCIGAIQHLKNKYGGGYNLELKLGPQVSILKTSDSSNTSEAESDIAEESTSSRHINKLVMDTFPNAVLDEQFEERITYKIPQADVTSLSGCFAMLEKIKEQKLIQEYALSQTTIEQVFLQFARQQEEESSLDE